MTSSETPPEEYIFQHDAAMMMYKAGALASLGGAALTFVEGAFIIVEKIADVSTKQETSELKSTIALIGLGIVSMVSAKPFDRWMTRHNP